MTSKMPDCIMNHRQAWLLKPIYRRLHFQNKMFSAVIVGEPGSGKSFSAMALSYALDRQENGEPRFSIDRVCFSASQFAEAIAKDWPKGTAIIMDDAGLNLYSREAMNKTVRQIAKVFQSCRYKNLLIFLTLPTLSMLDKTVRTLLNAYIQPVEIIADLEKVRAKFHYIETNPKTGKIYYNRPEVSEYVPHPFEVNRSMLYLMKTNSILIDKPPMDLVNEYEKRKKAYLDEWYIQNIEKIKGYEKAKASSTTTFQQHYQTVIKELDRYLSTDGRGQRIDAAKLILAHPEISMYTVRLIARTINIALKEKQLAEIKATHF